MGTNPKLSAGDQAPTFELPSDTQGTVTLADLKGQKTILYFYPKDNTPGCTKQACGFRDNLQAFADAGFQIYGVSPDPVDSHETFRADHDLNFPLLADTDQKMAQSYGVWREKTTFGNTYEGIVRSTFILDEDNTILEIQDNVRAKGHVDRLVRDLLD